MALDYNVIGARLKKAREDKNLTQQKLAEIIDVSVPFLSRVETGKYKINLKRLNELCELLEVSKSYILEGASDNSSDFLNSEFNDLIKKCPPEKLKMVYNVVKAIIESD